MPAIDLGSKLLNFLASHDLHPGDRLPTITELQDDEYLGISASKVREELEVARALGLVEVRSRTGMRLKEYSFAPAVSLSLQFALASQPELFEMFKELRVHIETAFWEEACKLLEAEDIAFMQKQVQEAWKKLNAEWILIPHEEHRIFHLAVFRRLDNPFVSGLLEAYWDAYDAIHLAAYADYDYWKAVWDYHEQILEHIKIGDFAAAKVAFIEHTQLLRYQPQPSNNGRSGLRNKKFSE